MKENILIIGKGNILLKDEGIGVHVIRRIQGEKESPSPVAGTPFFSWADTEVIESGTSFLDIIDQLNGRTKIIIIDAIQSENDPPGTIYRFTMADLKCFQTWSHFSLHHINLLDLLYLTSFLEITLPEIIIIGINIKEIVPDRELSKELECKLPHIIELIQKECLCLTDR